MSELLAARLQMAFTLGAHVVLACFGVGLPVLLLVAEGLGWRTLARRWSKAFAVLFAVGAVSGTVLSFELGLLWPRFMEVFGSVIGLPFTLEAFAFFLEAIFLGIYLYGWDRLSPRAHWWSGVPIAIAGLASAAFVVCANAWMNAPAGFRMEEGRVVDVDPIAAMLNPASAWQAIHLVLAAYLVTGFCIAGAYALELLRGRDTVHARRALGLGLAMGAIAAPLQLVAGDGIARMVARTQPLKLAAMEGQLETTARAPLHVGGVVEVPGALSWLAYGDADAVVKGLDAFPPDQHPPVAVVQVAFQLMVASGTYLLAIAAVAAVAWLRKRRLPASRAFRIALVASAPISVLGLQAGWTVTEVGRQPWIAQGWMRTAEAVTEAPGIALVFGLTLVLYALLGATTVVVLRRLARAPLSHGT